MANEAAASRRAQRVIREQRRHRSRLAAAVSAALLAGAVVIALVLAGGSDDETTTIEVDMFEFGFDGTLTAPAGAIRISATNTGQLDHNIGIRSGPISGHIRPGARFELDLGELAPGTYELYCDLVGHVDAGMVAPLVITERLPTSQS